MTKNSVSYQDLYRLVDERTALLMVKMDKLDERVSSMEVWRAAIKSQVALIAGAFSLVVGVPVALAADWIKSKTGLK